MAIQRHEINWDTQTINKADYGIIIFHADHLSDKATALADALREQREGIAEMVGQVFLDNHADDVSIVRLMRDIRDYGQEVNNNGR